MQRYKVTFEIKNSAEVPSVEFAAKDDLAASFTADKLAKMHKADDYILFRDVAGRQLKII